MRKAYAVIGLVLLFILVSPSSISAAPNQNASHVAWLASENGGGYIADLAHSAGQGVSDLAKIKGPLAVP